MKGSRIILSGGGDQRDSRPLDEIFAKWTGERGRLLYLPTAMLGPNGDLDACEEWLLATFRPLGLGNITMWRDLQDHDPRELDAFASIYIGGGNTFRLLHELRETSFEGPLRRYITQGGTVYGGSAGAIILGSDISTCAQMDENSVGLTDTRGLDLIQGHAIWCHYLPSDDPRIFDYCRTSGIPVLAMSERAGLQVEGEQLTSAGYEPVFRFDPTGKQVIELGE